MRARSANTRRSPPKPAQSAISAIAAGSSFTVPIAAFAALAPEFELAARFGIANVPLDRDEALALEPALDGVFRHAVHWTGAVSVNNPLALTRAYAARFAALGGLMLIGNARTLHRADSYWRVETAAGPIDAGDVVLALGPWALDVLGPLGIQSAARRQARLSPPFRSQGNAALSRPVLDTENGYVLAPMEQGIRVTTGVEFAARDAPPTPVQFDRLLPAARPISTWRASRGTAVAWRAAVFSRLAAGDRAGAGPARPLARHTVTPIGA